VNRRMIVFQIFYVNVRVHVSRVGGSPTSYFTVCVSFGAETTTGV